MDCPCEQSTKLPLQTIGYLSRFGHGLRPGLSKMGSYEPIVDLSKRIESHQDFAWAAEQTLKSPQTLAVQKTGATSPSVANEKSHPKVAGALAVTGRRVGRERRNRCWFCSPESSWKRSCYQFHEPTVPR